MLKSRARVIPVTGMAGSTGEGLFQHLTRQCLKASQQSQMLLGRIKKTNEMMDKVPL